MKYYENMDNFGERVHFLKVTFQSWNYKWDIVKEISGNCFWSKILNFFSDFDEIDYFKNLKENNINIKDIWDYRIKFYLKNEKWELCEFEEKVNELKDKVVKLEIIECNKIKEQ